MKYLKYLLIIMLIFSFAMVSCKKDSTTESGVEPIVGTWNIAEAIMGFLITTNSNQVATNPFDGGQTNISANTPTFIQLINLDGEDGFGLTSIEFRNDGTATVTEIDEDGTFTENWEYTTEGDLLTITDEFGVTDVFEYFIVGNTLTMVITDIEDYCGDYGSQAECFTETEALFELTQGSLTAVSLQLEIILNQAAAKQGLNVGRTYNLIDPTKVITDYKLKIKNIKQTQ